MKRIDIICRIIAVVLFTACNNNNPIEEQLTFSQNEVILSYENSNQSAVIISCNTDWEIAINYIGDEKDWLTVTPKKGLQGDRQEIKLVASLSKTKRKAILSFSHGSKNTSLTVIQLADQIANYHVLDYQIKYIRSLQLASGAIKDTPYKDSKICPYFANIACFSLLAEPNAENIETVKKYIVWYLSKLNGTKNPINGNNEMEGSIYDYYGEQESTLGAYDSVDSYAATFLSLVKEFASLSTENMTWLQQYSNKIDLVISAMITCIDQKGNGLSFASFTHKMKYLMDNCEVNKGLNDAIYLANNGLLSIDLNILKSLYNKQTSSIELELWMGNSYNWYNVEALSVSDWNVFYPDATAQLYPVIFGAIDRTTDRAKYLYKQFNNYYPNWAKGEIYSGDYPWAIVAYSAAVMGDKERVDEYIRYIYTYNEKNIQANYWYSLEAAFTILAIKNKKM